MKKKSRKKKFVYIALKVSPDTESGWEIVTQACTYKRIEEIKKIWNNPLVIFRKVEVK